MIFTRRRKSAARNRTKAQRPGWLARLPSIPWKRLAPAGALIVGIAAVLLVLRMVLDQPGAQRRDLRPLPAPCNRWMCRRRCVTPCMALAS